MNINKIPARNFWLALGVQLLLLASVPAKAIYTLNSGTTVFLQTTPVDPVDLLRGYYQTLGYEVSTVQTLAKLPGGEPKRNLPNGQEIFVTLALPPAGQQQAAQPIAVSLKYPSSLPANAVVLRGIIDHSQVKYDLEQFYMPEQQQAKVNQDIDSFSKTLRERARQSKSLLMEIKIGQDGRAVPVAIWVGDKSYRF
jgi:uncharacterized membrane-anchored protein